jgi:1-acyl-sn-glycerol-3-phosphate acyltransferase
MFYIRLILMGIWIIICCIVALAQSVFRWKDPSLDRDFGRMFAKGALKITGISLGFSGQEFIEPAQPCIYTSNHQSNFDIVVFAPIYPGRTVIIGKRELLWIPLFGLFNLAAGNIMIDRRNTGKAKSTLAQVVEEIKTRNVSVWVFPEGTRNKSGEGLLPFKKGAFHMAIAAQVPVVPVVASSLKPVADFKKRKIYGGKIEVKVLPPVSTEGLTDQDVEGLANKVREQMLQALSEIHSTTAKDLKPQMDTDN